MITIFRFASRSSGVSPFIIGRAVLGNCDGGIFSFLVFFGGLLEEILQIQVLVLCLPPLLVVFEEEQ